MYIFPFLKKYSQKIQQRITEYPLQSKDKN